MSDTTVDILYRKHFGKMVASLVSYFGISNLALAEDLVQDTFTVATDRWRKETPDDPEAWLYKVCKNKAINALDKKNKEVPNSNVRPMATQESYRLDQLFLDQEIKDNQLRLLFACCHPCLSLKAQIILTLRSLCGLKTYEIAAGLGMAQDAITKSLNRSRHILIEERIPLRAPFLFRSRDRVNAVHMVLYLMFNEGYHATAGDDLVRKELCLEAMRLIKVLQAMPQVSTDDTHALMALMCFHTARYQGRTDENGTPVELENQNRTVWDPELIHLGVQNLKKIDQSKSSRFIVEAAIASVHCSAKAFSDTNWDTIVSLYEQLKQYNPSPFTDLNHAVAVFYAHGPRAALEQLDQSAHIPVLKTNFLYHAFLAKTALAEGRLQEATAHYEQALHLTKHAATKTFFQSKLDKLRQ